MKAGRKPDPVVKIGNGYFAVLIEDLRIAHGGGRTSLTHAFRTLGSTARAGRHGIARAKSEARAALSTMGIRV